MDSVSDVRIDMGYIVNFYVLSKFYTIGENVQVRSAFQNNPDFFFGLFIYALLVLACVDRGIILSPDSMAYGEWADKLIEVNFSLQAFFEEGKSLYSIFYLMPTLLMSFCKIVAGEFWSETFFIFNMIFLALSIWILIISLRLVGVRKGLIAGLTPLLFVTDFQLWPSYVLTDTLFAFLVISSIYFSYRLSFFHKKYIPAALLFFSLLIFSRPVGPVVSFLLIFSLILTLTLKTNLLVRIVFPATIFSLFAFGLIYGVFFEYYFSLEEVETISAFENFVRNNHAIKEGMANFIQRGTVVHDRSDTNLIVNLTSLGIAKLYIIRVLYFFMPIASTYSIIHNVANILILGSFFFGILLWIYFIFGKHQLNQNLCRLMFFLVIIIFGLAFFQAINFIDWDWRYRFPTILPMLMIFVTSIEQWLQLKGATILE